MKRKGFTLIELLVVIAIIAILVSILLPSISKARELARRAVCKTNLKGFVSAFVIYQDSFNSYPTLRTITNKFSNGASGPFETLEELQDDGRCNIQPLFLLHSYCDMELDQFGCPSDEDFYSVREHPDWEPDMLGFADYHNVSYAFPVIYLGKLDGWNPTWLKNYALNRSKPDTSMYMAGDRPREDDDIEAGENTRLEKGSEPHGEDGAQFLAYNGAVTFEANNFHSIEVDADEGTNNVFIKKYYDGPEAKREVFLWWGTDDAGPPWNKSNDCGEANGRDD